MIFKVRICCIGNGMVFLHHEQVLHHGILARVPERISESSVILQKYQRSQHYNLTALPHVRKPFLLLKLIYVVELSHTRTLIATG
jgi:hypothetical protein